LIFIDLICCERILKHSILKNNPERVHSATGNRSHARTVPKYTQLKNATIAKDPLNICVSEV
ncbi:MAG: hypothetical protein ACK5UP_07215, partial [Bacteroidota bacterium]